MYDFGTVIGTSLLRMKVEDNVITELAENKEARAHETTTITVVLTL